MNVEKAEGGVRRISQGWTMEEVCNGAGVRVIDTKSKVMSSSGKYYLGQEGGLGIGMSTAGYLIFGMGFRV